MNLIYIHGLDSDANSTKGLLLEKYCQHHHPDITVLRPDLNKSPAQVREQLLSLIDGLNNSKDEQTESPNTVLVGSSLGGYFSTLISNQIGCPALLLNPSIQPHVTLQRFLILQCLIQITMMSHQIIKFYIQRRAVGVLRRQICNGLQFIRYLKSFILIKLLYCSKKGMSY